MYRKRPNKNADIILLAVIAVAILAISPLAFISSDYLLTVAILIGIATIAGGLGFIYYTVQKERKRLKALSIADIDHMDGVVFEQYVGELLKFQGFKIQYTATSGDYGVDIVATKDGDTYAVQIKRYTDLVGRAAISDAVAGMNYYKANKCMVVTNSRFTPNAKHLAQVNNCQLVDRSILVDWIVQFQENHLLVRPQYSVTIPRSLHDQEPMTDAQRKYLHSLGRELGEMIDEHMTKTEASLKIDELRARR